MGVDICIYLDVRQPDRSWRATKLPHVERDYDLFAELGEFGTTRYDDDLGIVMNRPGVVERLGLPEGFVFPKDDYRDPRHDSLHCLTPTEVGKAVGRVLAKRGWIGRKWTMVLFSLASYDWRGETDDAVRLVFFFS